jgi:glutathione S-transferase
VLNHAETVGHQASETRATPILYSFRRCPYAIRARLALKVSGFAVELREVLLRDKPEAFLEASPSSTVPVMALPDGEVIDESLDIMLHALRRNDPEGWLTPDKGNLDGMLALIGNADGDFKRDLDRAKYPNRHPDGDPDRAWHAAIGFLNGLAPALRENGGWLFGPRASLADMALLPFVRQFAHIDRQRFDGAARPEVTRWLDGFLASPLFAAVMDKYPAWQPGARGAHFP